MAVALPVGVGIGLKTAYVGAVLETPTDTLAFVEVHAENYLVAGGPFHRHLQAVRAHMPLSLHGVGLSLGGREPLDRQHLADLRGLIDRYQPAQFSEHLAWSTHDGLYLPKFGLTQQHLLHQVAQPCGLCRWSDRVDRDGGWRRRRRQD